MAVGAGMGALSGKLGKSAIDKQFQDQVRDMLEPGTSALFLVIEKVTPDKAVDAMTPKVLEEVTGLKGNTVRPLLKRLSEDGLIVRRMEGYAIHNAALHLVGGAITRKE